MSMAALSTTNSTRWNLVISQDTNIAVRSFLAVKGFKKGDLSSFVEEAVRWRVFDQTLTEARSGIDAMPDEAQTMLDEALAAVRAEGLASGRYADFRPSATRTASAEPPTSQPASQRQTD
jgi:uncharacterized membrane protein YccC